METTDLQTSRTKAQVIGALLRHISTLAKTTARLNQDVCWTTQGHMSDLELRDTVNQFNALSLPKCFVGVDPLGYVHVTFTNRKRGLQSYVSISLEVKYAADYVWILDSLTQELEAIVDRQRRCDTGCLRDVGWLSTPVQGKKVY